MNKKVLVLTATFGNGHHSVSKALKEELESTYDVEIVDMFDILNPKLKRFSQKIYNFLTKDMERLYNFLYTYKSDSKNNMIDGAMYAWYHRRFNQFIDFEQADTIISTFPMTSGFVSRYKEKTGNTVPLITVITDVVDSWEWVHDHTDQYFVPTVEVKDRLRLKGIASDKIVVSGIPVGKAFKIEHSFGPVSHKKKVLLMSSAMGKIKFNDQFLSALEALSNIEFTIVTGTDEALYDSLNQKHYQNIEVLGFVDNIAELMESSDLIYTKAGGVTLFEAIHKTIPLLIQDTQYGQESANVNFVKKREIGVVIQSEANFLNEMTDLLKDDNKLVELKRNMYKVKKEFKKDLVEAIG